MKLHFYFIGVILLFSLVSPAQDTIKQGPPILRVLLPEESKPFYEQSWFNTVIGFALGACLTLFITLRNEKKEKLKQAENDKREAQRIREIERKAKIKELNTHKSIAESLVYALKTQATSAVEAYEMEEVNNRLGTGMMQQQINNRMKVVGDYYNIQSEFVKQVSLFTGIIEKDTQIFHNLVLFRWFILNQVYDRKMHPYPESFIESELIQRTVQPIIQEMDKIIIEMIKNPSYEA